MKPFPAIFFGVCFLGSTAVSAQELTNKWTPLLTKDGRYFDTFIGVPHTSLTNPELANVPKGDGMKGTPLGLNNDPLHVFTIEMVDGKPVLHISGQMFGGYSTKKEFGNYHLKAEVKFGENKYEPKLKAKRDNGILYHAKEPHGQFWNVWMRAHEFQVQEDDMGDYYALAGVGMDIRGRRKDTITNKGGFIYDPKARLGPFASTGAPASSISHLAGNFENPHGEWTTVEIYCFGDKSIHVVNGHVVMILEHSRTLQKDGTTTPLTDGKIQIQSEGAEAYYRNIEIKKLDKMPDLK